MTAANTHKGDAAICCILGRFSCLRPVRIQVVSVPKIYTDKRPDVWQRLSDAVKLDTSLPCTYLPHHLTNLKMDNTWPAELTGFPFGLSDKNKIADLLRRIYPQEPRLIKFSYWLNAVADTHPEHDVIATELIFSPALLIYFSALFLATKYGINQITKQNQSAKGSCL